MVLTGLEDKVLKAIAKSQLLTKKELVNINLCSDTVIDSATKSLLEKGFITSINPVGSTCYMITKNGKSILEEME